MQGDYLTHCNWIKKESWKKIMNVRKCTGTLTFFFWGSSSDSSELSSSLSSLLGTFLTCGQNKKVGQITKSPQELGLSQPPYHLFPSGFDIIFSVTLLLIIWTITITFVLSSLSTWFSTNRWSLGLQQSRYGQIIATLQWETIKKV